MRAKSVRLAEQLEAEGELTPEATRAAFDAFVERMDAFDTELATRLARGMFSRDKAVWSVFCVEGALRRGAPADPEDPLALAAFEEAEAALLEVLAFSRPEGTPLGAPRADAVALDQRLALLYAGFGRHAAERRVLGAAMGAGGVDATQIVALKALSRRSTDARPADPTTAAALFASLLDRSRDGAAQSAAPSPLAPWALRGHGLGVFESALP